MAVVVMGGVGAGAWWLTRPPPPPPEVPLDQQKFEDADRAAYEQWMKELGYTD
jgi:hypothetical protein